MREMNRKHGRGGWVLAYDKDSKHTAEKTLKYLRRSEVNFLLLLFIY